MNTKRITSVVGLLALLIACEDQPTAMIEVDNLEPQLINTDKGNWVEIEQWRVDWTDRYEGPCASEPLLGEGTTFVWGKEHVPPAGDNSISNYKCTYGDDTHYVGEISQTRWDLVKMNCTFHQQTKHSDGMTYWKANTMDQYENEDGDKLHFLGLWWYVFDPFPILVSYRFELSCGPRV